ncbi:MAG: VOC family protein [Pseudomonadales bacterium]
MSTQQVQLHHYSVTAPADVIAEVVDFYGKLLGFTPGYRPDFGFNGEWLYSGDHPILHLLEDPGRGAGETGYLDHIALRCENLDQLLATLKEHNIDYFEFPSEEVKQHQVFVKDPAGTTIELNFQLS